MTRQPNQILNSYNPTRSFTQHLIYNNLARKVEQYNTSANFGKGGQFAETKYHSP
ncbi:MAG: hypothetical protein LBT09_14945 [Planctomycetaceae bacterium]|nr:hypothetical protein [Planctomycetaceae bacterium]